MRIELRTTMAGPNGVFQPGSIIDIDDAQAKHLIDTGQAIAVLQPVALPVREVEVETATEESSGERAAMRTGRARGR